MITNFAFFVPRELFVSMAYNFLVMPCELDLIKLDHQVLQK